MNKLDTDKAIKETFKMMSERDGFCFDDFTKYSSFYLYSDENIEKVLNSLEFSKNRALVTMAAGDHAFNLIYFGVKNIDTFDINILCYFIFHLKKAIFLAYDYHQSYKILCKFGSFSSSPQELLEILNHLKQFMSDEVYAYFKIVLQYNDFISKERKNPNHNYFALLCRNRGLLDENDIMLIKIQNLYCQDKFNYQQFLDNLEDSHVTFRDGNIESIPYTLDMSYDFMHFSNIADYYISQGNLAQFMKIMGNFKEYLNDDGIIVNYFMLNDASKLPLDPFTDNYTIKKIQGHHQALVLKK